MYQYKRLLLQLKITDCDIPAIRYAAMISKRARSEKVYFVHIAESLDIPDALSKEYPELLEPVDQFTKEKMEEMVKEHFDGHPKTEIACEAVEGKELYELLNRIREKSIYLVLACRKDEGKSMGELSEKLVRKAPCFVLIIPEGSEAKITKILIASDFSENSADAMDVAINFAAAAGLTEVIFLHAYTVPIGYYETGKSYEEFGEIMKKNAEKEYLEFIGKFDLKGLSVTPLFLLEKKPAKAIRDAIEKENVDLVLLGAQGRSAGAAVLIGSTTEHLIWQTEVPLLAVKEKGHGMGILDAILKL